MYAIKMEKVSNLLIFKHFAYKIPLINKQSTLSATIQSVFLNWNVVLISVLDKILNLSKFVQQILSKLLMYKSIVI